MDRSEVRKQWEAAAPGWAKWEAKVAELVAPASEAMLDMAGIGQGSRVLDFACGAGTQALNAARRVGPEGEVVASDISEAMLHNVRAKADEAGLGNVSILRGAAEELDLPPASFDAAICRMALMHFADPIRVLSAIRRALKSGGRVAALVFTTPGTNPFMAKPMQVLLRHAGKEPPAKGQPGIFALGAPGVAAGIFTASGFTDIAQRTFRLTQRLSSAAEAVEMMREAFGAYRAVISDCPETVQVAAWEEVAEVLRSFETEEGSFEAPGEFLVIAGTNSA